jgi:hypothetical protein
MYINQEVDQFGGELGLMAGRCVGCFMATGTIEEDQLHERDECPLWDKKWGDHIERMEKWQKGMRTKGVMADYSGCFWCGVPQAISTHWEPLEDDRGRFKMKRDGVCLYAGVLMRVWAAAAGRMHSNIVDAAIGELDTAREYDWQESEDEPVYEKGMMRWLGERVQWGHLQTKRFCQGFHRII